MHVPHPALFPQIKQFNSIVKMDFDVVEIVVVVVVAALVIGLLDSVEICLASSGREGGGGEDTVVASLSITFSLSHARCLAVFADSDQKA
jgi:hypothetical protein